MIRFNRINRKWARKLLRTKNFLLATDTEGVIYLGGIDPHNFDDLLMVTAQAQELQEFRKQIDDVIKRHKVIVEEVTNAKVKAKKPTKKIKVN